MEVTAQNILELVNEIAPFDLAEHWDNSGLQAGNLTWPVKKIMTSLDITMAVLKGAKAWGADLVLSHHPLMMSPENSVDFMVMPGSAIALAAREKICILSAHTNLDKARKGLNDFFSEFIGLEVLSAFLPDHDHGGIGEHVRSPLGLGRICSVRGVCGVKDLAESLKKKLGLDQVRVMGNLDARVKKVAVCTGSGGSLVQQFLASEADLYITGDLKYHDAMQVQDGQKAIIDVGHFGSEHLVVDLLRRRLKKAAQGAGYDLEVKGYAEEQDPFIIV